MKQQKKLISKNRDRRRWILLWILSSIFLKLIIISRLDSGIWLGADGESYVNGAKALLQDGFYSKSSVLQYWPAGYPITIALIAKIFAAQTLPFLAIFQSVVFAYAIWHFSSTLSKTSLASLTPWISFFLSFAPTLSLSSLTLGYESLVSSLLIMISSILFRVILGDKRLLPLLSAAGLFSSYMVFLQPRYVLVSLIWMVCLFVFSKSRKPLLLPLTSALLILALLPGILVARNQQATGSFVISTNLGTTMNIGAGVGATGGYVNSGSGVDCDVTNPSDSDLVKCVIKWYLNNPRETFRLAWSKSLYFWSPWYGPNANGTMARNPWLKFNPIVYLSQSDDGKLIVFGKFGKTFSYAWTFMNLFLMIFGLILIMNSSDLIRRLWWILAVPIATSWVMAIGTIGDHRFRLPIMGFVIICEIVGINRLLQWRRMRDLNPR